MPKAALKPCAHPACKKVVHFSNRFCEQHQKANQKQVESRRESAHKRGYGTKWRAARAGFLRSNPFCVHCMAKGLVVPATEVDHIVPHKGDQVLFWDAKNRQALCKSCHSTKTATEDGGFGAVSRVKEQGGG
jgi:5-methylcytosine-specific restriction protein A